MKSLKEPFINEIKLAKIKRLPLSGLWEAGIIETQNVFPTPDNPEKKVHMGSLVVVKNACRMLLRTRVYYDFSVCVDDAMENLMDALIENGSCPTYIDVQDSLTKSYLQEFCSRLGIALTMKNSLKVLDETISEILPNIEASNIVNYSDNMDENWDDLTDEEAQETIEMLTNLNDKELVSVPYVMRMNLFLDLASEKIPEDLATEKWDLLDPTFDDVKAEDLYYTYRIRFSVSESAYFELQLSGVESFLTLGFFVRGELQLTIENQADLILLPDGTTIDFSQEKQGYQILNSLNLKRGSTFVYKLCNKKNKQNALYTLNCEVLYARKCKTPVEFPEIIFSAGLPTNSESPS